MKENPLLKILIIFTIITLNNNAMALSVLRGNSHTLTESYTSSDSINLRLGGELIVNSGVNITVPSIFANAVISQSEQNPYGISEDVPSGSTAIPGFEWSANYRSYWDYFPTIYIAKTKDFGTVKFLGSSVVNTNIDGIDTISIEEGTVEFNGNLRSYYTNLTKGNSVVKFNKYGSVISTKIQNTYGINAGEVIFGKNHTFSGSIGTPDGRLEEVILPTDIALFGGDIYAKRIVQGKSLTITQNSVFSVSEEYIANSPTYYLGFDQTLLIQGNSDITGNVTFNITANSLTASRFVANTEALSNLISITINLTDSTKTIPVGDTKDYIIFASSETGGLMIVPNDIVNLRVLNSKNPFISWNYSNGTIISKTVSNVDKLIEVAALPQLIDPTDDDIANIQNIASTDSPLRSDLVEAIMTGKASEFIKKLPSAIEQVADNFDTIETLVSEVSDTLNKKIGGANNLLLAENDDLKGVSAGDEQDKYGIWTNYAISTNFQKKRGRNSGYVSKNNSLTFGTDTLINEDTLIGFALGYTDSRVHHKDDNLGDRSTIKSKLVSIYSVKELANNWYFQAQGVLGEMGIDNVELRGTTDNREYAKSSFKVPSYGLALETGRHFQIQNNFIITPFICLEFDVTGKVKYQESGTKNQNLSVKKAIDKNLIGNAGILVTKNYHINGHSIIPEAYALIRRDIVDKPIKVDVKTNTGQSILTRYTSNTSTFYNIGASINHLVKTTKISLGYDYYFGKKYASHQGFVGFKISF